MAAKFLSGGSPSNYTLGGIRLWFNRLVDVDATPDKYEGYRDLGNVIDAPTTPVKNVKEHFSARLGQRKRDLKLTEVVGEDVDISFDEMSFDNLKHWWMGDVYTVGGTTVNVASSTATAAVTDEVMLVQDFVNAIPLGRGYKAGTVVVKSFDGVTTHALTTDYMISTIVGLYKGILPVSGGTIILGDYIRVSYVYDVIAHTKMSPWVVDPQVMVGKATMFCVSKKGVEFVRRWDYCELESDGPFNYVFENWSNAKFKLRVENNGEVAPTLPFGVLEYYGIGSNIYKG